MEMLERVSRNLSHMELRLHLDPRGISVNLTLSHRSTEGWDRCRRTNLRLLVPEHNLNLELLKPLISARLASQLGHAP